MRAISAIAGYTRANCDFGFGPAVSVFEQVSQNLVNALGVKIKVKLGNAWVSLKFEFKLTAAGKCFDAGGNETHHVNGTLVDLFFGNTLVIELGG